MEEDGQEAEQRGEMGTDGRTSLRFPPTKVEPLWRLGRRPLARRKPSGGWQCRRNPSGTCRRGWSVGPDTSDGRSELEVGDRAAPLEAGNRAAELEASGLEISR